MAIAKGDCESAIVGGVNLILAPDLSAKLSSQGVLSPDGSCKAFSAEANGYARGEAIVSIYVKSLSAALRDGNPIRSVTTESASNFDGHTNPLTTPSATAQEALIRRTYEVAGISDFVKTGLFECHGTGTSTGDPIEAEAIAAVFGEEGLGANWSLEEELLKPTRTSRVYEAEFSQPLCTALQLGLVDTLAFVGITPAAVVGHSSGEIAAAYTAGALTAEAAIPLLSFAEPPLRDRRSVEGWLQWAWAGTKCRSSWLPE